MGKKQGMLLMVFFLAVMLGVVICMFPRGEGPVYQGTALSAWLKRLPAKNNDTPVIIWMPLVTDKTADELAAEDGVRHIGTNAIPYLMTLMHSQKSGPADRLKDAWERSYRWMFSPRFYTPHKTTADREHWEGAQGLYALGPFGKTTIPDLNKLLQQGQPSSSAAAYALSSMGPDGLPPLMQALTNRNEWIAMCAMWALGQTATNGQAVPQIMRILQGTNAYLYMAAEWSLGQIRSDPELEAPALAAHLAYTGTGLNAQRMTEEALKKYGMTGLSAADLKGYLNDPKLYMRMAATNAMRALHPEEMAKFGIQ